MLSNDDCVINYGYVNSFRDGNGCCHDDRDECGRDDCGFDDRDDCDDHDDCVHCDGREFDYYCDYYAWCYFNSNESNSTLSFLEPNLRSIFPESVTATLVNFSHLYLPSNYPSLYSSHQVNYNYIKSPNIRYLQYYLSRYFVPSVNVRHYSAILRDNDCENDCAHNVRLIMNAEFS